MAIDDPNTVNVGNLEAGMIFDTSGLAAATADAEAQLNQIAEAAAATAEDASNSFDELSQSMRDAFGSGGITAAIDKAREQFGRMAQDAGQSSEETAAAFANIETAINKAFDNNGIDGAIAEATSSLSTLPQSANVVADETASVFSRMQSGMQSAWGSFRQGVAELGLLPRTAEEAGEETESVFQRMGGTISESWESVRDATLALFGFGDATDEAERGSNSFADALSPVSVQLNQLAQQIQGGQDILLAFSQQSADIFILLEQYMPAFARWFTLGGIVTGVGAAFYNFVIPALTDTETAMDKLDKALEDFEKSAREVGEGGLMVLTEQMAELAKESEETAKLMMRNTMVNALKVIEASAAAAKDRFEDLDRIMQRAGARGRGGSAITTSLQQMSKEFDVSFESMLKFRNAALQMSELGDDASMQRLKETMAEIVGSGQGNDEFIKLAMDIKELADTSAEAQEQYQAMLDLINDPAAAANQSDIALDGDLDERLNEIRRLNETEREEIERAYHDRMDVILAARHLEAEEIEELMQKAAEKRLKDLAEIADKELEQELIAMEKAAADKRAKEAELRVILEEGEGLMNLNEDERDRIDRQYAQRAEWIAAHEQQLGAMVTQIRLSIARDRQMQLEEIEEAERQQRIQAAEQRRNEFQAELNTLKSVGDAFAGIVEASNDTSAASIAQTVTQVANMLSQLLPMLSAQAQAQAATDPVALSPLQKAANVASVVALFGSIVGSVARARSAPKGGGRRFGGSTDGTLMHEVMERGPELLTFDGKHYLPPQGLGKNGYVTPLQEVMPTNKGAGSGGVNIQVINNAGVDVSTTTNSNGDVELLINAKMQEIYTSAATGKGKFSQALRQGHNVDRRLR